jgi:hypothetical protein
MNASNWNERFVVEERIFASGSGAMNAVIDAAAVADNGDGTVELTCTAPHGFASGSHVYLTGLTNYSGEHVITAVSGAKFSILADYVAETPAGTETVTIRLHPEARFKLDEVRLTVNTAPTTSENFTVTLDSGLGAAFDLCPCSLDLSGSSVTDYLWQPDRVESYESDDALVFGWANTDGRTWGLEVKYRRRK